MSKKNKYTATSKSKSIVKSKSKSTTKTDIKTKGKPKSNDSKPKKKSYGGSKSAKDVNANNGSTISDNAVMGEIFSSMKKINGTNPNYTDYHIKSYVESKQFLSDHGIKISTISLDCKLGTLVNINNFSKYVVLKEDGIVSIKYGQRKNPASCRTIIVPPKKHSNRNFYNQVTILMKPMNNPEKNYINIKVFDNGSIQMTGCSDMDDFDNVMTTLINILKKGRTIKKDGSKKYIEFITKPDNIGIYDIKIRMINSNFYLDYKVDRLKLAKLLKTNHNRKTIDKEIGYVEFKHKPNGGHSCVNIKYKYNELYKPSIFVFQTGAIIITGAKNLYHIINAYHYIMLILKTYMSEIKIVELDPVLVNREIKLYCKERKLLAAKQFKKSESSESSAKQCKENFNKSGKSKVIQI